MGTLVQAEVKRRPMAAVGRMAARVKATRAMDLEVAANIAKVNEGRGTRGAEVRRESVSEELKERREERREKKRRKEKKKERKKKEDVARGQSLSRTRGVTTRWSSRTLSTVCDMCTWSVSLLSSVCGAAQAVVRGNSEPCGLVCLCWLVALLSCLSVCLSVCLPRCLK